MLVPSESIVFIEPAKTEAEPFTTSEVIAEYAEVTHHSIQQIVSRHKKDIKEFGVLAFEMRKPINEKGGAPKKIYHLTESQATLVITYLKNTAPVRAFKKELIRQFYLMRSELIKRQALRTELKPIRRELTDAIKDSIELSTNKWAYKQYTDLAYKCAVGKTASQIKRERGLEVHVPAVSFLTAEELERIAKVSNQIAVLIDLGMDYSEIKTIIGRYNTNEHS